MRTRLPHVATLSLLLLTSVAGAWSHQGHMLLTRLAALRIINDPSAPPGLRDFLKANMPYSMEECRDLALNQVVGGDPKNPVGLDDAVTLPDRIGFVEPGKSAAIAPYGVAEPKLHYMGMEWFSGDPTYKADLSNRATLGQISRDLRDPRWKLAGYVPLRVEECYKNSVAAFSASDGKIDNAEAVHWAGYLAHYLEDCHQPHHSTVDNRSYSYLAGKVAAVHEIRTKTSDGKEAITYRVDPGVTINPHSNVEYSLFENTAEPLTTFRQQYWTELTARIDAHAKTFSSPTPYDPFARSILILSESYEYLPAVGDAAQRGYASGKFDPSAFFGAQETVHGQSMTLIQLIADRNASAVLEVEAAWRHAWADAHPK
jgi:hypothetical protein